MYRIVFLLLLGLATQLQARTYTFAAVPQYNAKEMYQIWNPIVERMQKDLGITVKLIIPKDIPTFERELSDGRYDIAYMNPYHFLIARERQGYTALVRSGAKLLSGILVVHKDSKLTSVKALDGHKVAFPSPNALGASLLMRAVLKHREGITIEPVYVRSHPSVYYNVALNIMPAGGGVKRTFDQQPGSIRDKLKVLYTTPKVPPHPIAICKCMPKALVARVQRFFLNLDKTEAGKALLSAIPMTSVIKAHNKEYDQLQQYRLQEFYQDANSK